MVSDDAKAVKKQEEDNKSLGSASRNLKKQLKEEDDDKPIKSSSSGSLRSKAVKKEIDEKPLSSVGVSKEKELKNEKEEGEVKKKREKKVYDLPGQKRDQPDERDPLRIFYETLHKQVPTSEMAKIWLMESGLLPAADAKKVLEKKLQKTGKFSSPAKPAASTLKSSSKSVTENKEVRKSSSEAVSVKKQASDSKSTTKKRKKDSEDDDDDSGDDFLADRVPKKTRAK